MKLLKTQLPTDPSEFFQILKVCKEALTGEVCLKQPGTDLKQYHADLASDLTDILKRVKVE